MNTGAHAPIADAVGARPMASPATVISVMASFSEAARPRRSASHPNTRPPSGRARNPTANTANELSSAAEAMFAGKNALANHGESSA